MPARRSAAFVGLAGPQPGDQRAVVESRRPDRDDRGAGSAAEHRTSSGRARGREPGSSRPLRCKQRRGDPRPAEAWEALYAWRVWGSGSTGDTTRLDARLVRVELDHAAGCNRRICAVMLRPMAATAFATSDPLDPAALDDAPVRYPRPSRLRSGACRSTVPRRSARPRRSGLATVGDLLAASAARPPRGPGGGRARARRQRHRGRPGQEHLLAVGPPARDAAAGRGDGGRRDRGDEGDVLQPALARAALPGRDAAGPARQVRGAPPIPGPGPRADGRRGRRGAGRSRTTRPPRGCPRRRSSRWCASTPARSPTWSSRCRPGCGPGSGCPDRSAALTEAHFGDGESAADIGRADGWPSTSCCSCSWRSCAGACSGGHRSTAPVLGGERELTARWLDEHAAVRADRRPGARAGRRRRATWPARSRCSAC